MHLAPVVWIAPADYGVPQRVNFNIAADAADPVEELAAAYGYDVRALQKAYKIVCSQREYSGDRCNLFFRAWLFAFNHRRAR